MVTNRHNYLDDFSHNIDTDPRQGNDHGGMPARLSRWGYRGVAAVASTVAQLVNAAHSELERRTAASALAKLDERNLDDIGVPAVAARAVRNSGRTAVQDHSLLA